ncbi:DUF427 domain-containing protein [Fluviibacterium sp. DFM31]|uniref:DUF427 domain-containing protein n=1 Tax=Meridianimarinicoccus marinus TaxID=3231483 RepID=A0ABV3L805_9RHOB
MSDTSNSNGVALTIRELPGKWVVYASGAVYAETQNALELVEGDGAPEIFIPRADVAMAFFDKSDTSTDSAQKGTASFYSIETKSKVIEDAAWSYENPSSAAAAIKDHLTFDTDKVTVEEH